MPNNRSRDEIIFDILCALTETKIMTRVMFRARLSYAQLVQYRDLMIENGLIENKGGSWFPTKKGLDLLAVYETLRNLMQG